MKPPHAGTLGEMKSHDRTWAPLEPEHLYRLPWTLTDNILYWVEPTTHCNLYCLGCYRANDPDGDRPLAEVIDELETLKTLRRVDGISIAGGEPLIYPEIVELVRHIAAQGWKPVINTNGLAATPELIRKLTAAGLVGFTFHVDSRQERPGWKGKSEGELNELRLSLAKMTRDAGGGRVACAFNATVYRDTLREVPGLVQWAQEHVDLVQGMVFILIRSVRQDFDRWNILVQGKPVDLKDLVYIHEEDPSGDKDIRAQELVDEIRKVHPEFEPCAFLGGTADPRSFKWLLSTRVASRKRVFAYLDAKSSELTQTFHHFFFGTYMAYARPRLMRAFPALLPLSLVNASARKAFWAWLRSPSCWFSPTRLQALTIIQPVDILEDGRANMCDGCPDAILHNGELVWSCRVDELEKFGGFAECFPREP